MRIHEVIARIAIQPIVATVESGKIVHLEGTHQAVVPAVEMLERLFEVDSRYRCIWEIGFGINANHEMYPGNVGMNEVYGGQYGSIHWGLGLTPWTQYHLDIICPNTRVVTNEGTTLLGPPSGTRTAVKLKNETHGSFRAKVRRGVCDCHG